MAITKPFTFVAGTKARANEVNQNFDVLYSEVNSIDSTLTSIDVNIQSLQDDKANINGNASQRFQVAPAVNSYDAVNLSQLKANTPIGTIIMVGFDGVPDGYLKCNGATVSRSTYSELFNVIGVTYGEGDGSNTFQLPDFQNKVPWGKADDATLGYIEAGLPNITGTVLQYRNDSLPNSDGAFSYRDVSIGSAGSGTIATTVRSVYFDASKSNSIYGKSDTVQPPSVKTIFCIKY